MQKVFCFALLVLTGACSKKDDGGTFIPPPKDPTVDTINYISTQVHNFSQGWDTTNNYITDFGFWRKYSALDGPDYVGDIAVGGYTLLDSLHGQYRVKYVGGQNLIDPAAIRRRHGTIDVFLIRKEVLGKPLFEVYELKTNKLVKRYICGVDSAAAEIAYSVFDNLTITPKQTGDALNYYLTVKQTDQLIYY